MFGAGVPRAHIGRHHRGVPVSALPGVVGAFHKAAGAGTGPPSVTRGDSEVMASLMPRTLR